MFIFYGWGTYSKRLPLYRNRPCKSCNQESVSQQVVLQYSYISLFFIRIIRWDKRYFLQCPRCGYAVAIGKQEYLNIKNGVPQEQIPAAEDPFGEEFNAAPQTLSGITQSAPAQSAAEESLKDNSAPTSTEA
jgi:hypothetical protein